MWFPSYNLCLHNCKLLHLNLSKIWSNNNIILGSSNSNKIWGNDNKINTNIAYACFQHVHMLWTSDVGGLHQYHQWTQPIAHRHFHHHSRLQNKNYNLTLKTQQNAKKQKQFKARHGSSQFSWFIDIWKAK